MKERWKAGLVTLQRLFANYDLPCFAFRPRFCLGAACACCSSGSRLCERVDLVVLAGAVDGAT